MQCAMAERGGKLMLAERLPLTYRRSGRENSSVLWRKRHNARRSRVSTFRKGG